MSQPFFSIIIPVRNGSPSLPICLQSIITSNYQDWQLIVVDDGSEDDSAAIAQQFKARVIQTPSRLGPAAARNLGTKLATGRYLFFIDADCQLGPDTLSQMADLLQAKPQLDAAFGSYDDAPAGTNGISRYKNLLHHYIHQTSNPNAATFWTGCGAIRRETFLALGGFNGQRYPRPAIEDIELGYRLKQAGKQISLVAQIQVKHLKRWTLLTLLQSDIRDRAIPWAQLLLEKRQIPSDLNLQGSHRLSALAILGLLASIVSGYWLPAGLLIVFLFWLNWGLYRLFYTHYGLLFAAQAILLHWLYYFYSTLALLWVIVSAIP